MRGPRPGQELVVVERDGEVEKHPNADRLVIARAWGFRCCIGIDQFTADSLVAYIPPDSLIDTSRPEFAFLAKEAKPEKPLVAKKNVIALKTTENKKLDFLAKDLLADIKKQSDKQKKVTQKKLQSQFQKLLLDQTEKSNNNF